MPLLAWSVSALIVSAALLILAWRGRRVDDHPICRRCGFDLTGRPEDSTRCSECGADLAGRRAIRIGRREVRRGLLAVMLPAVVLSLGAIGVLTWREAADVDWNRHKPAGWLIADTQSRRPAVRDAALAELARRIEIGELPRDREEKLVERALAYQADLGRPWVTGWGGIVEAAHRAGRLSEEQANRYTMQSLTLRIESVTGRVIELETQWPPPQSAAQRK